MTNKLAQLPQRLLRYYPRFKSWHFWLVQFMVVIIAGAHLAIERAGFLEQLGRLYFVPISLLVVPVVYAAIKFGFVGSVSTAIWVVVISVPNFIFGHTGIERLGEIFQMGILVVLAFLIGQKVDSEVTARVHAEAANAAVRVSEKKYRGLFDSSPVSILVLDKDNNIIDANPAAGILFSQPPLALKSMNMDQIEERGPNYRLSINGNKWWQAELVKRGRGNAEIYLKPTTTQIVDGQGNPVTLVLLRDVTEEYHRQEGLKAYAGYMLKAQEDERLHIARELHDDTIQTLSLLCRELHSIDLTEGNLPPGTAEKLKKSTTISEEAVKGLRDFARALRPPILDDLGLVASVRRLYLDFSERTGVKGELEIGGKERRVLRDLEVVIFRIVQEALWNVEHHARASRADVSVAFGQEAVKVFISDDGIGFNVPPVLEGLSANGKLGLLGMKERAELFGGEFKIESAPGKGTKISASIPLPLYVAGSQSLEKTPTVW